MEPMDQLRAAERTRADMRRRARWYPAWVAATGLGGAIVIVCSSTLHGYWGFANAALLLLWIYGMRFWRERQTVVPVGKRRELARWMIAWGVLYVLVAGWIGPFLLRGQVLWLAVAGLLTGVPAFAEAVVSWVRLRR